MARSRLAAGGTVLVHSNLQLRWLSFFCTPPSTRASLGAICATEPAGSRPGHRLA